MDTREVESGLREILQMDETMLVVDGASTTIARLEAYWDEGMMRHFEVRGEVASFNGAAWFQPTGAGGCNPCLFRGRVAAQLRFEGKDETSPGV